MALVTAADVQAWLETTKLNLNSVLPSDLEGIAEVRVLSRLAEQYDVSGWTSDSSTPKLVKEIISMFTASYYYRRQYSEDSDGDNWYAIWLEAEANNLMAMLLAGTGLLLDDPTNGPTLIAVDSPVFYPNDDTEITDPLSAAKFTMNKVW